MVVGVASATWSQDQCAVPLLLDPHSQRLASGCVIDGAGGIDPIRLPATAPHGSTGMWTP